MKIFNLKNSNYKFLITGGTGLIGSSLINELKNQCKNITILSRQNKESRDNIFYIKNLDEKDFNYDVIINLSGEKIATFWTKTNKEKIVNSRINITKQIVEKIKSTSNKPKIFISGSAIGYYGISNKESFTENSQVKTQNLFSQNLCFDWENEAKKCENLTKVAIIRTGVVIAKQGGFLKQMLPIFKVGLGGKVGNGNQYLSWIHINDEIKAIAFIINNELSGEFNLSAPNPATNYSFTKSLAKILKKPAIFCVPAIAMKIVYQEMANELLLNGQKVLPQKLLDLGFEFQFDNLEKALEFELKSDKI